MGVRFCSFSSGSSGNCYCIYDDETAVLIDAGISGKKILEGLETIGIERERVKALLITHEHIDHVKSVRVLNKKIEGLMTYANKGTWTQIEDLVAEEKKITFETGETFFIGGMEITPFLTSHDANESVGYRIRKGDSQISILTDTGYVTEEAFSHIVDADLLILESNHDPNVLRMCSRPYHVIQRIAGDEGHLSNEACGECIVRIMEERPKMRQVLLAHLSGENNSPALAELTVKNILEEADILPGRDIKVNVIVRDKISNIYLVE